MEKELILASGSPRRREILKNAGFTFTVKTEDTDESTDEKRPGEVVSILSRRKAQAVWNTLSGEEQQRKLVLGADTIVSDPEGNILGKPADREHAKAMLKSLSGKEHSVYTGVTIIYLDEHDCIQTETFSEKSIVTFYEMDDDEIEWYAGSGECDDKAGAYAIQGLSMRFIKKLEGDYHNVVGLPAGRIYQQLKQKSITIH